MSEQDKKDRLRSRGRAGLARPELHTDSPVSPWRKRFGMIYRELRERITLLHYPPGTRLDVDALADEFSVSRTPIRSVLQRLEREGLAVTRHGVGTAVTEIDFEYVREAMQFRMYLAELIGTLDPKQPDPEVLETLDGLQAECGHILEKQAIERFASIDMRLHDCKCSLIGNEPLMRTYDELYYRTVRMWFYFLPQLDWRTEAAALARDIQMTRAAVARGDVKAVGFIVRNAIAEGLFRLGPLVSEVEG